jgi:DNA-binding protein HU-beta
VGDFNYKKLFRGTLVNKKELTKKVYDDLHKPEEGVKANSISLATTQKVIELVFSNIRESLGNGENVIMVGFGTFSVSKRNATTGQNPKTGEKIQIEAKYVAKFSAGKELKTHVHHSHKAKHG